MTLISSVVHETIRFGKSIQTKRFQDKYGYVLQEKALRRLLEKAKDTEFGKRYLFSEILKSHNVVTTFTDSVPAFDYNSMFNNWWSKSLAGEENICWPGKTSHFALTSGTSNDTSKRVPITSDIRKSIVKTGMYQFLTLTDYDLPKSFYDKSILMLGGCSSLSRVGDHFEGDLSGILTGRLPVWMNRFYKPGKAISMLKDWESRLEAITKEAKNWDIGIIAGVPAWVQILMERIIDFYKVDTIHDIWPNFQFFVHGGVAFTPYKKGFEKYLGKEINYQETYLASEGFLAYQNSPNSMGMQLIVNNGTFFEFVPFTDQNFSEEGNLLPNFQTLTLNEVKANEQYAILISTNAGAWRYLIGDVVSFTNVENFEIVITGRTKHFLSLCGEHLSVDNMNKAIERLSNQFDLNTREFTVHGFPHDNLFGHQWYIGTDKTDVPDNLKITERLDEILKELNDDYKTERLHALKKIDVRVLPNNTFYEWMSAKGKNGGQHKFPRVLKNNQLDDWRAFLSNKDL